MIFLQPVSHAIPYFTVIADDAHGWFPEVQYHSTLRVRQFYSLRLPKVIISLSPIGSIRASHKEP